MASHRILRHLLLCLLAAWGTCAAAQTFTMSWSFTTTNLLGPSTTVGSNCNGPITAGSAYSCVVTVVNPNMQLNSISGCDPASTWTGLSAWISGVGYQGTYAGTMPANNCTVAVSVSGTGTPTARVSGLGTVTGCLGTQVSGTQATCTVTPSSGYHIVAVSGCGLKSQVNPPFIITIPFGSCTITATFSNAPPGAEKNGIAFSFTIPPGPDLKTSAVVIDATTGRSVRQLWGNVSYPPGVHRGVWDGLLDTGGLAIGYPIATPGAPYTIKVMTNNAQITYDGQVGNTDSDWTGANRYGNYCAWYAGIPKIVFAGDRGFVACGYNEGAPNIMVIDGSEPNYPRMAGPLLHSFHQTDDIATDNQWVYLLNHCYGNPICATAGQNHNYVTALDASSTNPMFFSQGTFDQSFVWITTSYPASYIDDTPGPTTDYQTGIAVQRSGNILAVGHLATGRILLFDKKTGASLGSVTGLTPSQPTVIVTGANPYTTNVTPMAFTSEGLWYAANGNLFLITGLPGSPVVSQPITGLQYVRAVGSNAVNNTLYVADGGTHQQIYGYAPNTHALIRTIGKAGGMTDCNTNVTSDRLVLDNTAIYGGNSLTEYWQEVFVQAQDNDDIWVGDMQGQRIEHFDAQGRYVNRVLYRKPSYWVTSSKTMPTRVFLSLLEFDMDYSKPLQPGDADPAMGGNGAWTLAKYWGVCALGTAQGAPDKLKDRYYLISTERLSNGRVYAHMAVHGGAAWPNLFELPDNGTPMRNTGVNANALITSSTTGWLTRTGDVCRAMGQTTPVKGVYVNCAKLTGFDSNNNPTYAASATVASTATQSDTTDMAPAPPNGITPGEPSTDGYYASYGTATGGGPSMNVPRFSHMGGFKNGGSNFIWMAMPETNQAGLAQPPQAPDYRGTFPQFDATYGLGNLHCTLHTEGKFFLAFICGNWPPFGQQMVVFYEDGMVVGQFGINAAASPAPGPPYFYQAPSPVGRFGNAAWMTTVPYNGDIYVYMGDEGNASGHRWHLTGLNTIQEYAGTTLLEPNASVRLQPLSMTRSPDEVLRELPVPKAVKLSATVDVQVKVAMPIKAKAKKKLSK